MEENKSVRCDKRGMCRTFVNILLLKLVLLCSALNGALTPSKPVASLKSL